MLCRKRLIRRMLYISDLFELVTNCFPGNRAVVCADDSMSYSVLDEQSNRVARFLSTQLSVSHGDIVGFEVERKSISLMVCLLAVLKLGASYLLFSPGRSSGKEFVNHTFNSSAGAHSFEVIVTSSKQFSSAPIVKSQTASQEDKAYNVLTSGSTGKPKLVSISHLNILATFDSWEKVYSLTSSDVHLQMASPAFDVFTGDWVRALCSGGAIILCQKNALLKPRDLISLIDLHKPTVAEFVPSTLRLLMDYMELNARSFDAFRLLIVGSDIWYMHECERIKDLCLSGVRIINSYGVSEATIDSTYFEYTQGYSQVGKNSVVPIGKPFPHVTVQVLDEQGHHTTSSEVGKLVIAGAGVSTYGYTDSCAGKGGFFIKNAKRFYNTNDLVQVLGDGNILFLGRNEERFNVNGERLNFLYVESLLMKHAKVNSALIVPRLVKGRQYLEAFLILDDQVSKAELVAYLLDKASASIIPRHFYEITERVVSANGKDVREASCYPKAKKIEGDIVLRGNTQKVISEIWEENLGFSPITRGDVFSSVPGTSLEYMKIIAKVNEVFNVSLPLGSDFTTVGEMASSVERLTKREALK